MGNVSMESQSSSLLQSGVSCVEHCYAGGLVLEVTEKERIAHETRADDIIKMC